MKSGSGVKVTSPESATVKVPRTAPVTGSLTTTDGSLDKVQAKEKDGQLNLKFKVSTDLGNQVVRYEGVMPDGSKLVKRKLIHPEMPIPAVTTAVHGITDEMVKDAPTFKAAGSEIAAFIGDSDLAGYNSNKFDIPVLAEEFLRVDIDFDLSSKDCVDIQNIFHRKVNDSCKKNHTNS